MSFTVGAELFNALPGIEPTARSYSMGKWPQGRMVMRNGKTVRWGLSSRPTGDMMELMWENITYAEAEQLCIVWDNNYGIYGMIGNQVIPLTPELLAGTSGGLASLMTEPFAGATWVFAGPPTVEPVKARRCSVRIPIRVRGYTRYNA